MGGTAWAFGVIAALYGPGAAAEGCDFEDLTSQCSVFNPTGDYKIKLPDGTFIPNIAALAEADKKASGDGSNLKSKMYEEAKAQIKDHQNQVASLLDGVPTKKVNGRLKFALIEEPKTLGTALGDYDDAHQPDAVLLPWPPSGPTPRLQYVMARDVRKVMSPFFTKAQRDKLIELAKSEVKIDYKAVITDMFKAKTPLSEEMDNISPARRKRADELVQYVRDRVVANLVGTRPESSWTRAERAAVAKVRAIEYRPGDSPSVKNNSECMGVVPNAFYTAGDNSINICSGFYNYPDATFVAVVAHEISHSIDPCGAQFPVYKIDASKLEGVKSSGVLPTSLDQDEDLKFVYDHLKTFKESNAHATAFPFVEFLKDPKKIEPFVTAGILTPVADDPSAVSQNGSVMNGYLLADVYECLTSPRGGSFRQVKPGEAKEIADLVVSKRAAVADASYDSAVDRERITRAFTRYPQCISPRAETQMREASADWFGSKVLGDFLDGKELKTKEERLAPIAFFASLVCQARSSIRMSAGDQSIAQVASDTFSALRQEDDAHPADKSRIEKIFLADPRVRKTLGCGGASAFGCTHTIGGGGDARSGRAGSSR